MASGLLAEAQFKQAAVCEEVASYHSVRLANATDVTLDNQSIIIPVPKRSKVQTARAMAAYISCSTLGGINLKEVSKLAINEAPLISIDEIQIKFDIHTDGSSASTSQKLPWHPS